MAGIAAFFVAVGIGSLLGIDENAAGPLTLLPVAAMAFGVISLPVALVVLAVAIARAAVLPRRVAVALAGAAPLLPLMMIAGGLADGGLETVVLVAFSAAFAAAWVVAGTTLARWRATSAQAERATASR